MLTADDLSAIRRLIREELDAYDRDKGLTPRMGSDGRRYGPGYPQVDYRGHTQGLVPPNPFLPKGTP